MPNEKKFKGKLKSLLSAGVKVPNFIISDDQIHAIRSPTLLFLYTFMTVAFFMCQGFGFAHEAEPTTCFSKSEEAKMELEFEIANPEVFAGDMVKYYIKIRNTGDDTKRYELTFRLPNHASFVSGTGDITFDPESRERTWKGYIGDNSELEYIVKLLTRPDDHAGVYLSSWVGLDIITDQPPAFYELSVYLNTQIQGKPEIENSECQYINPSTAHGGFLFLLLFTLFVVIFISKGYFISSKRSPIFKTTYFTSLFGLGLLMMSFLLYIDLKAFITFEKTNCEVIDKNWFDINVADVGSGEPYWLMGVRYNVNNEEVVSLGYTIGSRSTNIDFFDLTSPEDFIVGRKYPCWYNPICPQQVILKRGFGLMHIGTLILFVLFLSSGSKLIALIREKRTQ